MKHVTPLRILVAGLVIGAVPCAVAQTFTGLGTGAEAFGVAGDGSVVVGETPGFRWTPSAGLQQLGPLPGSADPVVHAYSVSADGTFVVGAGTIGHVLQAYLWSDTEVRGLGFLDKTIPWSQARGVSADGSVVVGYSTIEPATFAFRWTEATGMVNLGSLPSSAPFSAAWAVSRDGTVIVGTSKSESGPEVFRWTEATGMVGLGDLPGGTYDSFALALSADANVIVGASYGPNGQEAIRWTQATGMVGLGDLPGGTFNSGAFAVSGDGSVVVGTGNGANGAEAFIWDATNGMRALRDVLINDYGLDLTGWTLNGAAGVSDDGLVIAGTGTHNGTSEGWVANLRPPCAGDVTGDNLVDLDDLSTVLFNFGQTTPTGDADGDGVVDLDDLATVLFNFGNGC
ncbi:MAG: hypothetical protein KDA20_01120 [Phycisphaerales bacterium]|nr:hypothetical protein [Phycisphaerales bacterium]